MSFILMLQLIIKLMDRFSYSITTHFIPNNKDYNPFCNSFCFLFLKICFWEYKEKKNSCIFEIKNMFG